MKPYLDSEDSYYRYNEESIKEELIHVKVKSKKDYAGIGAVIFTFTVLSIVIGLSVYISKDQAELYKHMDDIEDWDKIIKKEARGLEDYDLGGKNAHTSRDLNWTASTDKGFK
jgi:cell division protein FtsL